MGDTYSNILVHVIFSTKNREPFIVADLKPRLYAYVGGIVREVGGSLLKIGGVEDHVHLVVKHPPRIAVSELVRVVKANSSKWVHEGLERRFGWQNGYAAFSVSESGVPELCDYIDGQEEHHRRVSFKEEYLAFLRRHGIEFDERYVFD